MIGSAGGVCCQIVKQIIALMSLFVQRERIHPSSPFCTTDTILISAKGEALADNDEGFSKWRLLFVTVER